MKGNWISVLLVLALVVAAFGGLPAPRASAAIAVSFDHYPQYIVSQASTSNESPFPIYLQITGLNSSSKTCIQTQWMVSTSEGGSRYDTSSQAWVSAGSYADYGAGNSQIVGWTYLRNTATTGNLGTPGNTGNIRVRVREVSSGSACTNSGTTTVYDSPANEITVLASSTSCTSNCAGWLSEIASSASSGDMMVIKQGATIVGMYRASTGSGIRDNVWPGYPAYSGGGSTTNGYYKIPVPACGPACGYTLERWNYASPTGMASSDTQVNTMPDTNGNNTVSAGATTTLRFSTPTTVTLRTLTAAGGLTPGAGLLVVGLILAGGWAVARRRGHRA